MARGRQRGRQGERETGWERGTGRERETEKGRERKRITSCFIPTRQKA